VTGRVIELGISRGWTYEPPNVKIAKHDAIAKALQTFGVKEKAWTCELSYWAVGNSEAPSELQQMYASKVARLHYVVSRQNNKGAPTSKKLYECVLVDSKSGQVSDSGDFLVTLERLGQPDSTSNASVSDSDSKGNFPGASGPALPLTTNPLYAAAVPAVALLVVVLIWFLGGRTSRNA
jgi:hypothetical protein